MLSHLRFHRRGPSNPSSPNPDQPTSPWEPSPPQIHPSPSLQDGPSTHDGRPSSSTSSQLPPTLPPITRVTSDEPDTLPPFAGPSFDAISREKQAPAPPPPPPPPPSSSRSPYNNEGPSSGFMGGITLKTFRRDKRLLQEQQSPQQQHQTVAREPQPAIHSPASPALASTTTAAQTNHELSAPRLTNDALPSLRIPHSHSSGSVPTTSSASPSLAPPAESQNHIHNLHQSSPQSETHSSPQTASQAQPTTGKRPAGARLATEPAISTTAANTTSPEIPKGRKGLPFLKNPMSTLLMRRKTNQNAPDIPPLPLHQEAPKPALYDPRIRGTRVHDFSAPRNRKPTASPMLDHADGDERGDMYKMTSRDALEPGPALPEARNKSNGSDSGHSGSRGTASHVIPTEGGVSANNTRRSAKMEWKPLPVPDEPPDVPPKDDFLAKNHRTSPHPTVSSSSKEPAEDDQPAAQQTAPSTKASRSREVSLSGTSGKDVLSAVPRHMKSTSSRFSFDMIGAAKQEKLLEERHRQREQERRSSVHETDPHRDSRFDDLDEDGFDYDAMMDDDGLEEQIPGVNADYEDDYEEPIPGINTDLEDDVEEAIPEINMDYDEDAPGQDKAKDGGAESVTERDPDDDQENFAGFVFQRSNPPSALTSPRTGGTLVTPRDAEGKPIGFATTEEPEAPASVAEVLAREPGSASHREDLFAGLGIQGLDLNMESRPDEASRGTLPESAHTQEAVERTQGTAPSGAESSRPSAIREDDLYYEGGLLNPNEFDGEGDGSTFDESLFDLDDTDQYGRPIPGAFAAAQAARAAAKEPKQENKRASDSTSRLSQQSAASPSTAHTSVSAGLQPHPSIADRKRGSEVSFPGHPTLDSTGAPLDSTGVPAHAGEVNTATYQAALAAAAHKAAAGGRFRRDSSPPSPGTMPLDAEAEQAAESPKCQLSSYEDEDDGLGDDELGYAGMDDYELDDDAIIAEANADALASDGDGWYGSEFGFYSTPGQQRYHHSRDSSSNSGDQGFQYANGGFFGSNDLSRTKSGRMISREPNLTPITERSEYSNRNSVMSLAVPPLGSGPSSLASPGLAQLAMMSDNDDNSNMNFSALMRLRSRAWGGSSQISLSSSREGSPRPERAPDGPSSPLPLGLGERQHSFSFLGPNAHARRNSALSARSRDVDSSDAGSMAGSPTLTMSLPAMSSPPPSLPLAGPSAPPFSLNPTSPLSVSATMSPPAPPAHPAFFKFPAQGAGEDPGPSFGIGGNSASANVGAGGDDYFVQYSPEHATMAHPNMGPRASSSSAPSRRHGHKHKGSADSVSYVKEEAADSGETRWIVERRYTAESGEVEIERETLQQGRI